LGLFKLDNLMMMKKIFGFSLIFAMTIIAACEKPCPEQDVDSLNALYLDFKLSGPNSFNESDLQDLFMVRFLTDTLDTLSFQADTIPLNSPDDFYAEEYKIRISKNNPQFSTPGPPFYSAYNYSIQSTTISDLEVLITGIDLIGSYDEDDCIYTNTKKTFVLNGDSIDASGSTEYVLMGPN